jgi:hypothetical protein
MNGVDSHQHKDCSVKADISHLLALQRRAAESSLKVTMTGKDKGHSNQQGQQNIDMKEIKMIFCQTKSSHLKGSI